MEDDTTTPAAPATGVDESTQPVTEAPAAAVDKPDKSTEQKTEDDKQSSAADEDAQLESWAKKKGLELDSDNAKKAAKMAREAEKDFHAKRQHTTELEKATTAISDEDAAVTAQVTGENPELLKRLQRVEVREAVRDFWNQDGIDKAYEPTMIELLKTKPYLAGDLESLYATAVMKSGGVAAVKSQGKREALENLAHTQQAAVPAGSATTNGSPKGKAFEDLSIKEMEKKLGFAKRA